MVDSSQRFIELSEYKVLILSLSVVDTPQYSPMCNINGSDEVNVNRGG